MPEFYLELTFRIQKQMVGVFPNERQDLIVTQLVNDKISSNDNLTTIILNQPDVGNRPPRA